MSNSRGGSSRSTSCCRTSGGRSDTSVKILYLLTRDLNPTGAVLRQEHAKEHLVEVIDLLSDGDYDRVVDAIVSADLVISW